MEIIIFGLLLKIMRLKIMNGRKNKILQQKLHLMNHKKLLTLLSYFREKLIFYFVFKLSYNDFFYLSYYS